MQGIRLVVSASERAVLRLLQDRFASALADGWRCLRLERASSLGQTETAASKTVISDHKVADLDTITTEDAAAAPLRYVLIHPLLSTPAADALVAQGVDLVTLSPSQQGWDLVSTPVGPRSSPLPQSTEPSTLEHATLEHATAALSPPSSLLEALPLRRQPLPKGPYPPSPALARFLVSPDQPGALALLERLLRLGRDDVEVSDWKDGNRNLLLVQVKSPPIYLVMRACEEKEEGTRVYAADPTGHFWIEWGYTHPLEAEVVASLQKAQRAVLADETHGWRTMPLRVSARSLHDTLIPTLTLPQVNLEPAPGQTRFTVPLRLESGPEAEPELWILTQEELYRLSSLMETSHPDALARLTVSRTLSPLGVRYVLHELVRPSMPRLGDTVSTLSQTQGFARVPGTDNLFLPVGLRLTPPMRRDELRALLKLDSTRAVVLEARPVARQLAIQALDDAPLTQWLDYVSMDRRLELDRLLEESVFAFPVPVVESRHRPGNPQSVAKRANRGESGSRRRGSGQTGLPDWDEPELELPEPEPSEDKTENAERPDKVTGQTQARRAARKRQLEAQRLAEGVQEQASAPDDTADEEAEASLTEEELERLDQLERQILPGGCELAEAYSELGDLQARAGRSEDACFSLGAALFHASSPDAALAGALEALWRRMLPEPSLPRDTVRQAVFARTWSSPPTLGFLASSLLADIFRGNALDEELIQQSLQVFSSPDLLVSRRLSWLVLAACNRRAGDAVGMTRAKEAILGGLNAQGLSSVSDIPPFVRQRLAEQEGTQGSSRSARGDQRQALQALWHRLEDPYIADLEAFSGYLRLIFAGGLARLEAHEAATALKAPLEEELPVHDPPNRLLYRLYLAQLAGVGLERPAEAWREEVEALLSTADNARTREAAVWLQKRSLWLRTEPLSRPVSILTPELEQQVLQAEAAPETLPELLEELFKRPNVFEYALSLAADRSLKAALRSGVEATVHALLEIILHYLPTLRIANHRLQLLGASLHAAALVEASQALPALLEALTQVTGVPDAVSTEDLLAALRPGLNAARRTGVMGQASQVLEALEPLAQERLARDPRLMATLADGYMQVSEGKIANALLRSATDALMAPRLEFIRRCEAGILVLEALRRWPLGDRMPYLEALVDGLERFRDTFTVSHFYPTHKILIMERLVSVLVDSATVVHDRVDGFLAAEEQAIRRVIVKDWKQQCGR